ncbi:MAG: AAA family ATPase [Planctomycetota bacterium]
MSTTSDGTILRSIRLYRETLQQTRALFIESGEVADGSYGWLEGAPADDAVPLSQQMNELHQGFVMKIFASVVSEDRARAIEQRQLGRTLLEHVWGESVMGSKLHEAVNWLIDTARDLSWYEVTRPFLELPSLRDRWAEVETLAVRMANLIVMVDGDDGAQDRARVRSLTEALAKTRDAAPEPVATPAELKADAPSSPTIDHQADLDMARDAISWLRGEAKRLRHGTGHDAANQPTPTTVGGAKPKPANVVPTNSQPVDSRTAEQRLADARAKLDRLVGLDAIKNQIQTLANFLNMEKHRREQGLPTTKPSLHMAFVGNPGTGKTTVARIIAEIYGALGVLEKGHLVETDRSGLVAEYAGQTGPKTNAKIDEALDGVLFIDEAYTLIDESGQDQYGREAIQTLLKRMEDQRDRLVVILAGYPKEMTQMIRSNPGLSSRVGTTLHFDDYDPEALARIFELIAAKAKYELPTPTRRRLLRGFTQLYFNRDRHFGNGRTSRNAFERSVRRLANRIAATTEVTRDLLVTLQPDDIELPGITDAQLIALTESPGMVRVTCNQCGQPQVIDDLCLGTDVTCPSCQAVFPVTFGSPIVDLSKSNPSGDEATGDG